MFKWQCRQKRCCTKILSNIATQPYSDVRNYLFKNLEIKNTNDIANIIYEAIKLEEPNSHIAQDRLVNNTSYFIKNILTDVETK